MREIIFDTETTGLDPQGGDRLVEIGCVEMVNRVTTGRTYHAYFNPERDMPAAAEAVHGLSITFLSDKPKFAAKVDEILEFMGDSPLVARHSTNSIVTSPPGETSPRCVLNSCSNVSQVL